MHYTSIVKALSQLLVCVLTTFAVCVHAQTPTVIKDINQIGDAGDPSDLVVLGSNYLFVKEDVAHGRELWISDGTTLGTHVLIDIYPGPESSSPTKLTKQTIGGIEKIFFFATTPTNGVSPVERELWVTDGTQLGTEMVINLGGSYSGIVEEAEYLVAPGSTEKIFFFSSDGFVDAAEPWASDGTELGTYRIKDIHPGPALSSSITHVTALPIGVVFGALDASGNNEPWITNADLTDAFKLGDIAATGSSFPSGFEWNASLGLLFFSADDNSTNGRELYKSDLTPMGATLVKNISLSDSMPLNITSVEDRVLFSADIPLEGRELWISDGTEAGTVQLGDINAGSQDSNPSDFIQVGSGVVFAATSSSQGRELFRTNGTNVQLLKDIYPGEDDSSPQQFANVGGEVYFRATTPDEGTELWKTDGTPNGTILVQDIYPGVWSSLPESIVNDGSGAVFYAKNPSISIFKDSGGVTEVVSIADPVNTESSVPKFIGTLGTKVVLEADDGIYGEELWVTDGTEAGTTSLGDILPGPQGNGISEVTDFNGSILFAANDGVHDDELWISDGTSGGTVMLKDISAVPGEGGNPYGMTVLGDIAIFTAYTPDAGYELWKTDGTEGGTVLVKDIFPGIEDEGGEGGGDPNESSPENFIRLGDFIYFVAETEDLGSELWRTDGTEAGTTLVKDIRPGSGSGGPSFLSLFGDILLFTAEDDTHGSELWRTDGTEVGTFMIKDINPGSSDSFPTLITPGDTIAYFVALDETHGRELWKTDGTEGGTVLVRDIYPGSDWSQLREFHAAGDMLYFNATDGTHGQEPWMSDGTEGGTVLIEDLVPGDNFDSSVPSDFVDIDGIVFFTASSPDTGKEVWKYDGVTLEAYDTLPGEEGGEPTDLAVRNGYLFFNSRDLSLGSEPWGVLIDECPEDSAKLEPGVCGCGIVEDAADNDSDGTPNCLETCDNDPNKTEPLVCGCGISDLDSDLDGTPDCNDQCVNDPAKTDPLTCGCGVADADSDSDFTFDCLDLCPSDAGKIAPGTCGCGVTDSDADANGIVDCLFTAEFTDRAALLEAAVKVLKKLDPEKSKKKKKNAREKKNAAKAALEVFDEYFAIQSLNISSANGEDLGALVSKASKKAKKALKIKHEDFKKRKKKAKKALANLLAAL